MRESLLLCAVLGCITMIGWIGCSGSSSASPVVKRVDHVVILSNNPDQLFTLFTEKLGLPMAWPFSAYPGFATGGVQMGNTNIETIRFDKDTPPLYDGAPPLYREGSAAAFFGIVFEPRPLSEIIEELRGRGTSPTKIFEQTGQYGGQAVTLWSNVFLRSLGLDSYIVYLCEYSAGYKKIIEQHAVQPPLGGLGLLSVSEIVIGARDLAATRKMWDAFLSPREDAGDLYVVGSGPAVHLVAAAEDRIVSLVLEVASLENARLFLEKNGLLGTTSPGAVTLNPSQAQSLEIRLVEKK